LLGVPGELCAARALGDGPDAVEPVVAAHEVTAGPPEDRDAERAHRVEHVTSEPCGVAQRRAFLEDAPVDAAAEGLDEGGEDAAVHAADLPVQVDADPRHRALPALLYSRTVHREGSSCAMPRRVSLVAASSKARRSAPAPSRSARAAFRPRPSPPSRTG